MKRILYLLLLVAAVLAAPKGTDVGKLQPIEIVMVSARDNMVIMETDTEDYGKGVTVEEALEDLRERSQGIVLLDTAEYLLLERGAERYLEELKDMLKGNVRVCYVSGEIDLREVSQYLNIHRPKTRLIDVKKE